MVDHDKEMADCLELLDTQELAPVPKLVAHILLTLRCYFRKRTDPPPKPLQEWTLKDIIAFAGPGPRRRKPPPLIIAPPPERKPTIRQTRQRRYGPHWFDLKPWQ